MVCIAVKCRTLLCIKGKAVCFLCCVLMEMLCASDAVYNKTAVCIPQAVCNGTFLKLCAMEYCYERLCVCFR